MTENASIEREAARLEHQARVAERAEQIGILWTRCQRARRDHAMLVLRLLAAMTPDVEWGSLADGIEHVTHAQLVLINEDANLRAAWNWMTETERVLLVAQNTPVVDVRS